MEDENINPMSLVQKAGVYAERVQDLQKGERNEVYENLHQQSLINQSPLEKD